MAFISFDTEATAYLRDVIQGDPVEQAFRGNTLLNQLPKTNKISYDGGRYIHVNVSYVGTPQGGAFDGNEPLNPGGVDNAEPAEYRVSQYYEPCRFLKTKIDQATGSGAEFKYMAFEFRQAQRRLQNQMASDIWRAVGAAGSGTNPLEEIRNHINIAGTGTVGDIDSSAKTWWQNQQVDVGALASNEDKLDLLSTNCTKDGLTDWHWGICDKVTWAELKTITRSNLTHYTMIKENDGRERVAERGIGGGQPHERTPVYWENRPIYYDRLAPTGEVRFINNDAIKLSVLGAHYGASVKEAKHGYHMDPIYPSEGSAAYWTRVYWTGQLISIERSANGVGHNIS